MRSQTNIDEKSLEKSVNDGWGDWVEQDPTELSNEWFEEQSSKQAEIDQAVKARLREEQLAASLPKQPDIKEEKDERLDVISEALKGLAALAIQSTQPRLDLRGNSSHTFFTSHQSNSPSLLTEEKKKDQSLRL